MRKELEEKLNDITPETSLEEMSKWFDSVAELEEFMTRYRERCNLVGGKEREETSVSDISDEETEKYINVLSKHEHITCAILQRELSIGYPRVAKIVDMLERKGYLIRGADRRCAVVVK